MDDIVVALLCRNPDEEAAAEVFVSELSKPTDHPSTTVPQHGASG